MRASKIRKSVLVIALVLLGATITPAALASSDTALMLVLTPPADVTRAPGEMVGPIGVFTAALNPGLSVVDVRGELVTVDGRTARTSIVAEDLALAEGRERDLDFMFELPDWLPYGTYRYTLTIRDSFTGRLLSQRSFGLDVSEREICDGADNDGNGMVDEGYDRDADGFLACSVGTRPADCDDTDSLIHPGALEVCGDAVDNDCDDLTDETTCALALRDPADG